MAERTDRVSRGTEIAEQFLTEIKDCITTPHLVLLKSYLAMLIDAPRKRKRRTAKAEKVTANG